MQRFRFVAMRKLSVITDPCFLSMFAASHFENTTPHRANDVQHRITVLGDVMSLFVCKWI
jgi:hypothetical protein